MYLKLHPKKVFAILIGLAIILLCMNIIVLFLKFYYPTDSSSLKHLIGLFDFNTEMNIPTYYSSLILLFASIILFCFTLIEKQNKRPYLYWFGLAIIFIFLSVDEMLAIHEQIMWPVHKLLNTTGYLLFAWVIPYGLFIILLGFLYLKFLLKLPKTTALLFLVSAFVYILGAVGFELFEGQHYGLYGMNDIYYAFLYTCEEFLEMLGIAIFIYALLSYASDQFKLLKIRFT